MAEVDKFNCDRTRASFDEVERRFGIIARLAATTGPSAIGPMTRVAEADRTRVVEAAKAADHANCLGEKACQLTLQVEDAA
jgi:hypothetical protein